MGDIMSDIRYSFSKLDSFHNCKRAYYYTYIMKERGGESIYTFLGTTAHELTQAIIQGEETNISAIEKFIAAEEDADMLGLEWMSEKVKTNYVDCIVHFLENFNPVKADDIKIEDYFEVDIAGTIVKGYIDLWYFQNGEIHIYDLKTSSKFTDKDLPKKSNQLYIYAYALSQQYPDTKINLYFNMLKYARQNKKLVERNKINIFEEYTDGIVCVPYDESAKETIEEYVWGTVEEIDSLDTHNKHVWTLDKNPNKDFFCRNLCSYHEYCTR
jgi:RecB family exonuclease